MNSRISFLFTLLTFSIISYSQRVSIGNVPSEPSAILELRDPTKGLLIPRLTTPQRDLISSPAHGLIIMNVSTFCIEAYDSINAQWVTVSCPTTCTPCDSCIVPALSISASPTIVCPGDTVLVVSTFSERGGLFFSTPTGWSILTPGDLATFLAGEPGMLYVSLCNECGCIADSILLLRGTPPSAIAIAGPTSLCVNDTLIAQISSVGANRWQWILPPGWTALGNSIDSPVLRALPPPTPGTHLIVGLACNGCGCLYDTLVVSTYQTSISPLSFIDSVTKMCAGIQKTIRVNRPASITSFSWIYPSTWTVSYLDADSIILIPDVNSGTLSYVACDNCACDTISLAITTGTCENFCLAIGGSGTDKGTSIVFGPNGNYYIAGQTTSFGAGGRDVYVIALDVFGNLLWTRTVGGTTSDANNTGTGDMILAPDNSLIVGSSTTGSSGGVDDFYFVKLSLNGNLIWTRAVGGAGYEYLYELGVRNDGTIVAIGYTNYVVGGNADPYIVRFDLSGSILDTITISGTAGYDWGMGVTATSDGGIVVTGNTDTWGSRDMHIVKFDANFNVQWSRTAGGSGVEWDYPDFHSQVQSVELSNGDIIVAGYTASFGNGDIYVVRLNSAGTVQWIRTIGGGGADYPYDIIQTRDGNVVIVGFTNSFGAGGYDVYVVKINPANGNIIWTRVIGNAGNDYGYKIVEDDFGMLTIAGTTTSFGNGGFDVLVIRMNEDGTFNCTGCLSTTGGATSTGGTTGSGHALSTYGSLQTSPSTAGSGGTPVNNCP
ncbi:MAG: hypothetical protein GXO48_01970 [Chlorobi bacterium]|nr:hypothetical protein [Chlorobiota bacterium]